MEHILCAAIFVETRIAEPPRRSYTYPHTGLVFSGWRHGDCFTTLHAWADLLSIEQRDQIGEDQIAGRNQGFLTSTGRYVDRVEAATIAYTAGQISTPKQILFSEDLY